MNLLQTCVCSCLVLAIVPAVAAAQPAEKSPAVARTLAIGTTVAGYGMVVGGFLAGGVAAPVLVFTGEAVAAVGPSVGHLYAGETRHALVFSGVRAGALLAANIGIAVVIGCIPSEAIGGGDDPGCDGDAAAYVAIGGLAVAAGFGLYDWLDSGRAARRHNRRQAGDASGVRASISPLVDPAHTTYGLAIGGAF